MVSISSVFCTLASPKVLAFDKTNLNKFYLLLFSLIRTFMSFRVMKLGCIWEKKQKYFAFSTHLDKFLTLKKTNTFAFFLLNRNFALTLPP